MNHDFENNIKCPYCDYEDIDSWEFNPDHGNTHCCGSCGEEFEVERHMEVTYCTSKISCYEKDATHNYELDDCYIRKQKFEKGMWIDLPEWEYTKIEKCTICDEQNYIKLPKEEYEELVKNKFR